VEFRLLGPVEVARDGQPLAIGGAKPRALLAMLLLHRNTVVARDRLIEGLWGEAPPANASHSLDDYVSRLRKAIGHDRLVRRTPGYRLLVEPGELDLDSSEELSRDARACAEDGDAARASALFADALELWQGKPLADVLAEPFAAAEARRLEEVRLDVLEERIEADLSLGRRGDLVSELEQLAQEHPYRERFCGQLMVALYGSGQQARALEVYRATRRRLAEDLGLEPGPRLRLLERQILEHDPSLRLARETPKLDEQPRRSRRVWLMAGAGVAVVASTLIGVSLGTGSTGARIGKATSSQLLELGADAQSNGQRTALASAPAAAALGGRSLWLTEPDSGLVVRIETTSGNVDPIPVGGEPTAIAVGGRAVWVADSIHGGSVLRIDPAVDKTTQSIRLGGVSASALAFRHGRLWVADPTDESLLVVNPLSGEVTRTIPLSLHPSALAFGDGGLWVADYDANLVAEIDPRTGQRLTTVDVGSGPAALVVDPHTPAVWVANFLDSTVSRISPDTGRLTATIPVGSGPSALALDDGELWVADEYSETISRIDPATNEIRKTVRVDGGPTALAAARRLFVATRPLGRHRGGTLVLLHSNPITVDPALQLDIGPAISDGLTRDDLVTTSHAGGLEGTRLVPDLALSVPAATDDGLTYTFRLRSGIHYSDGRLVVASDLRRELERVFRLDSPGSAYFSDIVGAAACTRSRCNLSRGIVTNDEARTVTFRLRRQDADFLFNLTTGALASPVPPGTPFHDVGFRPIPGTGPYRIEAASKHEVRYIRNPYFREWSHAAQPAGNPDQIVMRFGLTPVQEARAVEQGRADYTADGVPAPLLREVEERFSAQLHGTPNTETDTLQLNSTLPPFNDVRVRRALNLAVDRAAVADLYGGPKVASPTCQVLPPGISGYARYCPWTRGPRSNGRWRGPDLNRARALISASGTRGDPVTVWGASDIPLGPAVVSYAVRLLRSLGFRARTHLIPQADFGSIPQRVFKNRIQMTPPSWGDTTPDGFFGTWFLCSAAFNHHWFCRSRLDRAIRRAETLETTNPPAASRAWRRIDHEVTDQAAWVPLVNPGSFDFVSARVRNYQSTPGGMLADQVWFR
jgi:ABC-type transport system substrate-binding protein/DNA-binding SARP family transcriptional activator